MKTAVSQQPTFRRSRGGPRRLWNLLALLIFLSALVIPSAAPVRAQTTPQEQAAALLEQMTPEERVGQLFLVTFNGTDVTTESPIHELISDYHVGGVILLADNDNFTTGEQILSQVVDLTRDVQLTKWSASQQPSTNPITGEVFAPVFVPLFIGIPQEGDGYPYDQILSGMTPLPNQMALGATWNADLVAQVGNTLGRELSTLGINLLLGPSLDVLENPHPGGTSDLGTRTFGGDPFWVGKLGQAFVQGIHQGSLGQVAVIAKHFPGHGGSDRLPEEEVATVIKSLEELSRFDLAPFFAVTGGASTPDAAVDGLLSSHIRYQGFQGDNLRATTRPVSFDPEALNQLMSLPQIEKWYKSGGLTVSDNLGSQAIRRYYELNNQTFDMPRRVALNAFQAGNDLLYVADFSSGQTDSHTAAIQTFRYFAQKYREDPTFAQRVDQSVLRILTLKFRLYGTFTLTQVLATPSETSEVGNGGQTTFDVARQAATLISPSQADLDVEIPDPPNLNDRIVFISDSRPTRQCSQCPIRAQLDVRALQDVVLRRYGPQAGGLVSENNMASYTLQDLENMLNSGEEASDLERDLQRANWIVFAMLSANPDYPTYDTLSRFLIERPYLFQQKRLIVFAFGAPYYMDATDITKLTAYYALYSKAPQFIDMAAYLLFKELPAVGASPVSVPGISYDLNAALFPDPRHGILLEVDVPVPEVGEGTPTPEPPQMEFRVGDVLPLRTGVILDQNGKPVPDGTPVEFVITQGNQESSTRQISYTQGGVARTTVMVAQSGPLQVIATSDRAQSTTMRFNIPPVNGEVPPPTPTETPTPTPEPTPSPTVTVAMVADPEPTPPSRPQLADWAMALLVTGVIAWSSYRMAAMAGQVRWGVRGGFLALIGGLAAYSYLALQMPGTEGLLNDSVSRGVFISTLLGSVVGLLAAWFWRAAAGANGKDRTA